MRKAAVCAQRLPVWLHLPLHCKAWLYVPLGQPAVEGPQGAKSPGGKLEIGEEKGYGVVWGQNGLDSGKKEGARRTAVRRNFKEATHPALV